MKKVIIMCLVAIFAINANAQTTTTTVNNAGNKPNTTTTVMGKGLLITTTGVDANGNTWILFQNQSVKGKLKNWAFVVMSKSGEKVFSDNGKRGTFDRTDRYMNGEWAGINQSGSPVRQLLNGGRVYGSRITW